MKLSNIMTAICFLVSMLLIGAVAGALDVHWYVIGALLLYSGWHLAILVLDDLGKTIKFLLPRVFK